MCINCVWHCSIILHNVCLCSTKTLPGCTTIAQICCTSNTLCWSHIKRSYSIFFIMIHWTVCVMAWQHLFWPICHSSVNHNVKISCKTDHVCCIHLLVDPHRVHCTTITKRLKFYMRLVMWVARTLCRESYFQFPWNWGKYSATNLGHIAIHPFILEMWKCSCDGCVINNLLWLIIAVITMASRMDTPE